MPLAEVFLVLDEPDLLLDVHSWIKSERSLPDGVEVGIRYLAGSRRHSNRVAVGHGAGSSERERRPIEIRRWLNVIAECTQIVHVLGEPFVYLEGDHVVLGGAGLLRRQRIIVGFDGFFDAFNLELILESIYRRQRGLDVFISVACALRAVEFNLDYDGVE